MTWRTPLVATRLWQTGRCLLLLALALACGPASEERFPRGPYLQLATPTTGM